MRASFLNVFTILPISLFLILIVSVVAVSAEEKLSTADPQLSQDDTTSDDVNFIYSPKGRRDPFKPLVQKKVAVARKGVSRPVEIKGPLEQFELSQYRLVAMMVVKGNPRAMVKGPDGKGYTVKLGEYIGLNDGVVKKIETKIVGIDVSGMRVEKSPDRIVIEEVGIDTLTGKVIKEYRYIIM